MNAKKTRLIQDSWNQLGDSAGELAEFFYQRLFELDPGIRDLFAIVEMEDQRDKFGDMLAELVRLVGNPDAFESVLEASGRRHRGYGVVRRHYATVGEALLWALNRTLPEGLEGETREAWAEAYTRMAYLMQQESA